MNPLKFGLPLLGIISLMFPCVHAQPGMVSLNGKDFRLNGEILYPLVCCYCLNPLYNDSFDVGNVYLSPDFGYGPGVVVPGLVENTPNYEYECQGQSGCLLQLMSDFTKIRSMGFHAIRTCGLGVNVLSKTSQGFTFTATRNQHPNWTPTLERTEVPIFPPYVDNPLVNPSFYRYCRLVDDVLYAAGQCNLKVLLDIGDRAYAPDQMHWIDYGEFLKGLAHHCKEDTNLMAYVVFEEPRWQDSVDHTKAQICEITSLWYDKIREEDEHHLITIGGCLEEEAWEWDPAVVKADFISPHPYPAFVPWENYSYTTAYQRFLGRLVWLQRNSPIPWIIGEMAIGAMDDMYGYTNVDPPQWARFHLFPPLVHTGDLNLQKQFAQQSLADVRNCGGSGYSWWQFQETWWVGDPYTDNHNHDAMGLLRHAPYQNYLPPYNILPIEKPVVEAFENYPNPPPNPQAVQQPANYGNPFNGTNHIISGYIHDQDGQPIRDAVISAQNYYDPLKDNITLYGFTDNDGYYAIGTPYNFNTSYFDIMKVSAVGCGVAEQWINASTQNPINKIISRPLLYKLTFSDESSVQINEEVEYMAISEIEVQDLTVEGNGTIGGAAVFKARNSISVEAEFWAKRGSDVHILTGPFLYDCSIWPGILIEDFQVPENKSLLQDKEVQIEFFVNNMEYVRVYPNPASGLYQIILSDGVELDYEPIMVQVFNCVGQKIYAKNVKEHSFMIDLTDYPAGSYYIKVQLPDEQTIKKIVKL